MKNSSRTANRKAEVRPGDILEIRFRPDEPFTEYASIDAGDVPAALAKVEKGVQAVNLEGLKAEFRIVRKQMGTTILYGPKM